MTVKRKSNNKKRLHQEGKVSRTSLPSLTSPFEQAGGFYPTWFICPRSSDHRVCDLRWYAELQSSRWLLQCGTKRLPLAVSLCFNAEFTGAQRCSEHLCKIGRDSRKDSEVHWQITAVVCKGNPEMIWKCIHLIILWLFRCSVSLLMIHSEMNRSFLNVMQLSIWRSLHHIVLRRVSSDFTMCV